MRDIAYPAVVAALPAQASPNMRYAAFAGARGSTPVAASVAREVVPALQNAQAARRFSRSPIPLPEGGGSVPRPRCRRREVAGSYHAGRTAAGAEQGLKPPASHLNRGAI